MNLPLLTREQVRRVDRWAIDELGIDPLILMENAGRGCVDIMLREKLPEPYLICCGKGNNAGDGLVIARHLALRGMLVRVLLWSQPYDLSDDAVANYQILRNCQITIDILANDPVGETFRAAVSGAGTIIDALLGTGATGDPRAPYGEIIEQLNAAAAKRVSIDLPSGLDCDTGKAGTPTFRADHTITLAAAKPGLVLPEAAAWVGTLHLADIGVPIELFPDLA